MAYSLPYQFSEEESLPTKLIISKASSQDKPLTKFSNSWTKSTSQSTKLSKGTQPSKRAYEQEEAMKFPSILKNKQLIPQFKTDIPNPTSMILVMSSTIYLKMSTRTNFITMKNTDTSSIEEYSQDSLSRKEKTATTTGHFSTRKSMQGQNYQQLNSLNSPLGSNSKSLNH